MAMPQVFSVFLGCGFPRSSGVLCWATPVNRISHVVCAVSLSGIVIEVLEMVQDSATSRISCVVAISTRRRPKFSKLDPGLASRFLVAIPLIGAALSGPSGGRTEALSSLENQLLVSSRIGC